MSLLNFILQEGMNKETKKIQDAVLCEHIRSIDYEERKIKYIENVFTFEYKNMMDISIFVFKILIVEWNEKICNFLSLIVE